MRMYIGMLYCCINYCYCSTPVSARKCWLVFVPGHETRMVYLDVPQRPQGVGLTDPHMIWET